MSTKPSEVGMHYDLEKIKAVACWYAKDHDVNYNIIIQNPDASGNFNKSKGSTYEFVRDSYFEKERPFAKKLISTNEILGISEKFSQNSGPRPINSDLAEQLHHVAQLIQENEFMFYKLSEIEPITEPTERMQLTTMSSLKKINALLRGIYSTIARVEITKGVWCDDVNFEKHEQEISSFTQKVGRVHRNSG